MTIEEIEKKVGDHVERIIRLEEGRDFLQATLKTLSDDAKSNGAWLKGVAGGLFVALIVLIFNLLKHP